MVSESVLPEKPLHLPSNFEKLSQKWQWSRLDEVSDGVFDCPHSTPKMTNEGPFVVRTQDIITGQFRSEKAAHVSEATYVERVTRVMPMFGDILYSREGTYFGIAAEVPKETRVCLGQRMVLIRPNVKQLNHSFLRYWLNSPVMALHIRGYRDGTVAERLNLPTIRALPILVPSLPEQKRIAHVLGTLDDKIELNRRMNATLEAMSRAIFKSWFVDFDPVRQKAAGNQPVGMDTETAALFPDSFEDSELGEVPTGWDVISLSELIDIKGGTQPPKSKWSDEPKPGYVRMIQIRDYYTDSHIAYVPDAPNLRRATKEDVMIARYGASVGRICWGLEGAYNVALVRCEMQKPNTQEFVRSYLLSSEFQNRLEMMSNRSAQAGFNKGDIASFKLVFPTKPSIFQAYENFSKTHLVQVQENKKQSRTLAALRDTLLPKLLSGEIRVPEAEEAVEEAVA